MQELTQRDRNIADISQGAPTGLEQATHAYPCCGPGFLASDNAEPSLLCTYLAAVMCLLRL